MSRRSRALFQRCSTALAVGSWLATLALLLAEFLGAVGFCHNDFDPSVVGAWAQFVEELRFRANGLHGIGLQVILGTAAQSSLLRYEAQRIRMAWRGQDDGRALLAGASLINYGYSLYLAVFERPAVTNELRALHFATAAVGATVLTILRHLDRRRQPTTVPQPAQAAMHWPSRGWLRAITAIAVALASATGVVWFFVVLEADGFLFDFALQPAIAVACVCGSCSMVITHRLPERMLPARRLCVSTIAAAGLGVSLVAAALGIASPIFAIVLALPVWCLLYRNGNGHSRHVPSAACT